MLYFMVAPCSVHIALIITLHIVCPILRRHFILIHGIEHGFFNVFQQNMYSVYRAT